VSVLMLMALHGFDDVAHTGGGCRALMRARDGAYVMVTDEGGCELPKDGETVLVGIYADGDVGEMATMDLVFASPEAFEATLLGRSLDQDRGDIIERAERWTREGVPTGESLDPEAPATLRRMRDAGAAPREMAEVLCDAVQGDE